MYGMLEVDNFESLMESWMESHCDGISGEGTITCTVKKQRKKSALHTSLVSLLWSEESARVKGTLC